MEELLMEMKSDVSRLPGELAKIPSVSTQLKMDEISTISKAAHKETAPVIINNSSGVSGGGSGNNATRSGSVITHTHTPEVVTTSSVAQPHVSSASVISEGLKRHSTARSSSPRHSRRHTAATAVAPAPAEDNGNKVSIVAGNNIATAATAPVAYATTGGTIQIPATATGATIQLPVSAGTGNTAAIQLSGAGGNTIQLPPGCSLIQTADGLVVYQGVQTSGGVQAATGAQKTATIVQQGTSGTQSYAIGVPTYVDGSGGTAAAVYLQGQTVQLVQVPAVSGGGGQQVMYWPQVVQGGQAVTTTQAGAQIAVLSTDANGAPVITID